jgi:hypothetical protein
MVKYLEIIDSSIAIIPSIPQSTDRVGDAVLVIRKKIERTITERYDLPSPGPQVGMHAKSAGVGLYWARNIREV